MVRATIVGVQTVALQTLRAGAPRRAWARASEPALVKAAQRGSAEAFAELFRRHWPRAHRAAWLVVHDATAAEDVAQEAFLAAVRALDRFDRRRPFGPWLHRIVVNRAIDYARARELRREVADAGIEPAAIDRADAPGDDVLVALAALPPDQRAVIVMRHLLGFTPGEIASALELPRGTVNSRLRRGLDGLQEAMRAMSSLRDRLEGAPLPDPSGAQARAWALLADAHRERPRAPRVGRRGRVLALALVTVLVAAAVAVAAQPPRWVRHVLGSALAPHVHSSLGALPAGRLLVSSAQGTWIVRGDGTRLRLGPWTAATWSPRGLYVAAWRGRELSAVAPNGRVAWTIAARGPVRDATWSPDGYRIAYRRDDALAVVAGDGTGARVLAQPVRPVAPAWRPGAPHTLAWVGASGPRRGPRRRHRRARLALRGKRRRGAGAGLVGRRPSPAGARRPASHDPRRHRQPRLARAAPRRRLGQRGGMGAAGRSDGPGGPHRRGHQHPGHDVGPGAAAGGLHHHRHAALAGVVAQRPAPARAPRRGGSVAPALPRHRPRPDHRHRRHLAALRQRAHRAGLVLRLS